MRAMVTGGSGFVGRHLVRELANPLVLSRNPKRVRPRLPRGVDVQPWDPLAGPPPVRYFTGLEDAGDPIEVVFHLLGESLKGRWSAKKRRAIADSRIAGTRHMVDGIAAAAERGCGPKVLVSAAAIGIYGNRGDDWLTESAVHAPEFLADLCARWEHEAKRAEQFGVRVVHARMGLVLGVDGGVLPTLLPAFKLGFGARMGDGAQWMSWIHVDDLVTMLRWSAQEPTLSGAINAVAPNPVTQSTFTNTVAAVLRRPALLAAPKPLLKAALGDAAGLLLDSQRVTPAVAMQAGFSYKHPELEGALKRLLRA